MQSRNIAENDGVQKSNVGESVSGLKIKRRVADKTRTQKRTRKMTRVVDGTCENPERDVNVQNDSLYGTV